MTNALLWAILITRAKLAYTWRIGLINRTTAFHWEMDRALGELTIGTLSWKVK